MADDTLLTTAQAADMLATSTTTVRRMFHDGDLPAIRHRGTLKFRRSAINAYIDAHTETNEPRERTPRALPERRSADIEQRYPHLAPKRGVA